ncbi:MAG: MurT ligase domain-containing protein [Acidothermus sp.]|nr:MurT ligase domain-containing protein [Acidothermus sp.]
MSPHSRVASGLRLRTAIGLGAVASSLSRALRRGDGQVIGGRVVLSACPDAFGRLTARRHVTFVSATNGKTTTTRLLAAALRTAGPIVTNLSGANMPAGMVSVLARTPDSQTPAVFEADETYLPGLLAQTPSATVVLGNLTRDQLDRVGEVAMVARRWRTAFADHPALAAVANADDPHVVWAASVLPDVVWVGAGQPWRADAACCPECGAVLRFDDTDWSCGCGLRRPEPTWWLDGDHVAGPSGRYRLDLALPGRANRANAVLALAAAARRGVTPERALAAFREVASVGGRYQVREYAGRRLRLLLGKNPAGWVEMFDVLAPAPAPVIIAINARAADGRDPSWLWDVPFERLAGRLVVATGERCHDLAVRLLYAGVRHVVAADLAAPWPQELGDAGSPGGPPLDLVATYTAFRDWLRRTGGDTDVR